MKNDNKVNIVFVICFILTFVAGTSAINLISFNKNLMNIEGISLMIPILIGLISFVFQMFTYKSARKFINSLQILPKSLYKTLSKQRLLYIISTNLAFVIFAIVKVINVYRVINDYENLINNEENYFEFNFLTMVVIPFTFTLISLVPTDFLFIVAFRGKSLKKNNFQNDINNNPYSNFKMDNNQNGFDPNNQGYNPNGQAFDPNQGYMNYNPNGNYGYNPNQNMGFDPNQNAGYDPNNPNYNPYNNSNFSSSINSKIYARFDGANFGPDFGPSFDDNNNNNYNPGVNYDPNANYNPNVNYNPNANYNPNMNYNPNQNPNGNNNNTSVNQNDFNSRPTKTASFSNENILNPFSDSKDDSFEADEKPLMKKIRLAVEKIEKAIINSSIVNVTLSTVRSLVYVTYALLIISFIYEYIPIDEFRFNTEATGNGYTRVVMADIRDLTNKKNIHIPSRLWGNKIIGLTTTLYDGRNYIFNSDADIKVNSFELANEDVNATIDVEGSDEKWKLVNDIIYDINEEWMNLAFANDIDLKVPENCKQISRIISEKNINKIEVDKYNLDFITYNNVLYRIYKSDSIVDGTVYAAIGYVPLNVDEFETADLHIIGLYSGNHTKKVFLNSYTKNIITFAPSKVAEFNVDSSNKYYSTPGGNLYNKDQTILLTLAQYGDNNLVSSKTEFILNPILLNFEDSLEVPELEYDLIDNNYISSFDGAVIYEDDYAYLQEENFEENYIQEVLSRSSGDIITRNYR